jgi:hypothetical protein
MPFRSILAQYNNLSLTGSVSIDFSSESKSQPLLSNAVLDADYGNQLFSGV